jgi:hypothetical protein
MNFGTYINENSIYDEYCNMLDMVNSEILEEGFIQSIKDISYGVFSDIKKVISDISNTAKISVQDIIEALKSKNVFNILKTFGWSLSKMLKCLLSFSNIANQGLTRAFTEIFKNKLFKDLQKGAIKMDQFLDKYPIIKKLTGPVLAGLLLYMWINSMFLASVDFDYDVSDILAAFLGKFTIENILGNPAGFMKIVMFVVGVSTGLSLAYLASGVGNLLLGLIYTTYSKAADKDKTQKLKHIVKFGGV